MNNGGFSFSFRDHLPEDDTTSIENVLFYQNKKGPSKTGDPKVEEIHKKWLGQWEMLEYRHNYIQFLFPIREEGMSSAQALTKNEAEIFRSSQLMQDRLIESYKIMLDFYGLSLKDKSTGEIERNAQNYEERYKHLDRSSHNYLRITRILKCLGICGLEYLKKPFIKHFLTETLENKMLQNTCESLFKYWLPTLRIETELVEMEEFAERLTGKKACRKWYNAEKRTWANVVYPDITKNVEYSPGKTFYNRDDGISFKESELINIDRYVYKRWSYNDK